MKDVHVDADLSAYLDGELAPAERAHVDAHLTSCDRCRARLGELRATASLIAALPSGRPTRSLVPHVAERWTWLRPLRALSAIASGAFIFAFLVTAVARSGGGLGGGDESTAIFGGSGAATAASAPAPAAPQASGRAAFSAVGSAAPAAVPAPSAAAVPALAPTVRSGQPADKAVASAAPSAEAQVGLGAGEPVSGSAPAAPRVFFTEARPAPLLDPIFWLGLAVIAAVAAIAAHMRLRTR